MSSEILNKMCVTAIYECRESIFMELGLRHRAGAHAPLLITFSVEANRPFSPFIQQSHIAAISFVTRSDAGGDWYCGVLQLINNFDLTAEHRDFDQVLRKLFAKFHGGRFQPYPADFVVEE